MISELNIRKILNSKNPEFNEILLVNSGKAVSSGWKRKEKLAKLIRKQLEKIQNRRGEAFEDLK